ncbi:MAG: sulfurtransferase [Candidatus Obscuribacterales bacterium]|nr:sulfurtransferase [Steroidobacteraceae bacterium]
MFTTLIDVQQLRECLNAPNLVIVDCRFDLAKPEAGASAYIASHLPGARYAHLDRDLSGPITPVTGRHPLPDPQVLMNTFERLGIDSSKQVVAYDADNGMFAARLWWLLRWLGHESVAVLNGGFSAWQQDSCPVTSSLPNVITTQFVGKARGDALVAAAQIEGLVKQPQWLVLDARAPERFAGLVEPIDPVAGHIPGARNHPFTLNLDANVRLLSASELRARYRDSLGDTSPDHVVAMCGSGVTACHNLLAMEIAGLKDAKLYAGSWSEWIRDPNRPTEKQLTDAQTP